MQDKGKTKKQLINEPIEMHQSSESKIDIDLEKGNFRLVVELVPNAILMVNQKGEIILVNPQARLIGMGRDLFALRKDGSELHVEIGLNPIKTEEGVLVLAAIVDITERKLAEEMLRESEERLQAVMDNTTDAIMVYDEDGMVIAMHKEAERLFCSNNKTGLKNIWDVIPLENRADFSNILKSVKEGSRLLDYEIEK